MSHGAGREAALEDHGQYEGFKRSVEAGAWPRQPPAAAAAPQPQPQLHQLCTPLPGPALPAAPSPAGPG
jgi:hypothetical protein